MQIFDIKFERLDFDDTIQKILSSKHIMINTINNEFLLYSLKDNYFKYILNISDIKTCDSTGLFFAFAINDININFFKKIKYKKIRILCCYVYMYLVSIFYMISLIFYKKKFFYKKYGDRIPGTDLIDLITKNTYKKNTNIYIIGSSNNTCENFKNIYKLKNKNISEIYYISFDYIIKNFKFTDFNKQVLDINDIYLKNFLNFLNNDLNKKKINYVYVALASPQSVYLSYYIFDKCLNIDFVIACGGAIDYLGLGIKRAPKWMRNIGLEFLYRLIKQPKYRYKRIFNAVFVFWYEVIKWKVKTII